MKSRMLCVLVFISFVGSSCVTFAPPENIFKTTGLTLTQRNLQSRSYQTKDEVSILSACTGALQDLEFTIDESEKDLGLLVFSKSRTAVNNGAVAGAICLDILAAAASGMGGGGYSGSFYQTLDKEQMIRGSVVCRLSETGDKIVVRVTFQRIVWNMRGDVSKLETLSEPTLYSGFYDRLSKAIFLEAENI